MKKLSLFLLFCMSISFSVNAQNTQKKVYNTKKVEGMIPLINGLMDDKAWDLVNWSGDFTQRDPNDGDAPSQDTKFKILYDDNNLYILVRAYDNDPESIVKRMSRRDGFDGDWVEVNIDSYFDKQTAFSFTASVSGVKGDEAITNDNSWDSSWDPIWYLETSIDDQGWIAEIRIPFSQLRFSDKEEQTWGIQLTRRIFRKEERSNWQYVSMDEAGWVQHFGELRGIKGIKPKRQIEISPYVLAKIDKYEKQAGNPYADGLDLGYDLGVDGKIGLTNNLTLDFTINPDFGQVEADPSEVNLTAFETYFSEKRPFFIEGKNITSFQISGGGNSFAQDNLFYSRRIGGRPHYSPVLTDGEYADMPQSTKILGAVKLTGKTSKGLSVGVMEGITAEEMAEIDKNGQKSEVTVEPLTNYFVGRVQQDLNNNNTIVGGMITSTNRFIKDDHLNFLNKEAYTGGVDFAQYWKNRKYFLNVNLVMSHIKGDTTAIIYQQESSRRYFQRLDNNYVNYDKQRTELTGNGGNLQFGKQGNSKLRYVFWVTWRSPELELNDVGYLRQADNIFQVFWAGYRITEPFSVFRNMQINFNQWSGWDFGMFNNFAGTNINFNANFINHWFFGGGVSYDGSGISNTQLRGGPSIKLPGSKSFFVNFGTDTRKKFYAFGNYSQGAGLENSSYRRSVGIDLFYRPIDALRISFLPDYSVSESEMQYIGTQNINGEDKYLFAKINRVTTDLTVRIDLTLSPNLTIQYYGSPFIGAGDYSEIKYITDPKASNYRDRFDTNVDFLPEGYVDNYDFNFREFRSNLVMRWEYKPGSSLYLVWNQGRTSYVNDGAFSYSTDLDGLFGVKPYDVFLVKFSYRFIN